VRCADRLSITLGWPVPVPTSGQVVPSQVVAEGCTALWAMTCSQEFGYFLALGSALLLDAAPLIGFQALRVKLAVPVGRERGSTAAAEILGTVWRFVTEHDLHHAPFRGWTCLVLARITTDYRQVLKH
jgi:hypothetical protein